MVDGDNCKDFGIILIRQGSLKYPKEVVSVVEKDPELLNSVYREISEQLGMDAAMEIYCLFKGQQITFPVRFFNPGRIKKCIADEYDGTNARTLAIKYGYSEKTIRRIIKENIKKENVVWDF